MTAGLHDHRTARPPLPLGERHFLSLPLPLGEGPDRALPLPLGEGRGEGAWLPQTPTPHAPAPRGFTLVELLVAVSIILILMTLIGGGVSAARQSAKANVTRQLIDKLDAVIRHQLATYDSASVPLPPSLPTGFTTNSEYRAWYIRRNLITADLPDRWADVQVLASGTHLAYQTVKSGTVSVSFPFTQIQRAHAGVFLSSTTTLTDQYGDAECLFMIVMRSGVADCVDCGGLQTASVGDVDGDSMPEFLDAWGNPIGFLLWPAAVQLPANSNMNFFSGDRSLMNAFPGVAGPSPTPTLGMRPLIFSAGPDGKYSINVGVDSNLLMGNPITVHGSAVLRGYDCGNPTCPAVSLYGALNPDPGDSRGDNITNLDAEAKR